MSAETKVEHTPGPWAISKNIRPVTLPSGAWKTYIEQGIAGLIAVEDGQERAVVDANAALIAAAPYMLETLERSLAYFDATLHGRRPPENAIALARNVRATIARARGES